MIELLRFMFESFGHFVGVLFIIAWITFCLCWLVIAYGFATDKNK